MRGSKLVAGTLPIWVRGMCLRVLGAVAGLFRRLFGRRLEPVYSGRQQLRRAARDEAVRQLGEAPVPRHIRRQAARDIARKVKGAKHG